MAQAPRAQLGLEFNEQLLTQTPYKTQLVLRASDIFHNFSALCYQMLVP